MILSILRNQKGIALITVYMASLFIETLAGAAFSKSLFEKRQVDLERVEWLVPNPVTDTVPACE